MHAEDAAKDFPALKLAYELAQEVKRLHKDRADSRWGTVEVAAELGETALEFAEKDKQ